MFYSVNFQSKLSLIFTLHNTTMQSRKAVTAYLKSKQLPSFGLLRRHPSKHETLTQCCFNVGPPSLTSAQHYNNIGSTPRVCWDSGYALHVSQKSRARAETKEYIYSLLKLVITLQKAYNNNAWLLTNTRCWDHTTLTCRGCRPCSPHGFEQFGALYVCGNASYNNLWSQSIRVGHSHGFWLPSVAILPLLFKHCMLGTHQPRHVYSMLVQCWATVCDADTTLDQHCSTLTARGATLVFRIWRLQTSDSED